MDLDPVALTSIADLRLFLDRDYSGSTRGTLSDLQLSSLINRVSAECEMYCHRWLVQRTTEVTVPARGQLPGIISLSGPRGIDGAYPIQDITSIALEHRDGSVKNVAESRSLSTSGWYSSAHDKLIGIIRLDGVDVEQTDTWYIDGTFGVVPVTNGALAEDATTQETTDYNMLSRAALLWCAKASSVRNPDESSVQMNMYRMSISTNDCPYEVREILTHFRRIPV